ncbi:uncharacterized protein EI90DRAFT_2096025 [Cantharellus anzutake]|uniref:uncharacterized protein n=1 Tax=Cantharellus anzutake TaxID=1750568 RepID=UPI0019065E68|nr:uncharacterized protein EI90DRAFT_2096025 [Cantharellus anzutake]KAF8340669.1 hypothetical protein EI90DRAFT_2096025 [Cantharellus anzutake]
MPFFSKLLLLASIFPFYAFCTEAHPGKPMRNRMIHLPLAPAHNMARTDVHPLELYSHHWNRAQRRHARMTGGDGMALEEKRLYIPPRPSKISVNTRSLRVHRGGNLPKFAKKTNQILKSPWWWPMQRTKLMMMISGALERAKKVHTDMAAHALEARLLQIALTLNTK